MVFARSLCSKLLSAHLTCCSRLTGLLLSCSSEALRSVLSDFCRSEVLRCQKMSRHVLETLSRVFKRIVHAVQKAGHVQLGVFRWEKLSPATFFKVASMPFALLTELRFASDDKVFRDIHKKSTSEQLQSASRFFIFGFRLADIRTDFCVPLVQHSFNRLERFRFVIRMYQISFI